MGLDVSHDAFSGAYSSFMRFRIAVIEAIGGRFSMQEGIFELPPGDDFNKRPGLYELLSHSDCDGSISPENCKLIADELELLLPILDKRDDAGGHIARNGGYGAVAKQFIAGCKEAFAANEPLEFM